MDKNPYMRPSRDSCRVSSKVLSTNIAYASFYEMRINHIVNRITTVSVGTVRVGTQTHGPQSAVHIYWRYFLSLNGRTTVWVHEEARVVYSPLIENACVSIIC